MQNLIHLSANVAQSLSNPGTTFNITTLNSTPVSFFTLTTAPNSLYLVKYNLIGYSVNTNDTVAFSGSFKVKQLALGTTPTVSVMSGGSTSSDQSLSSAAISTLLLANTFKITIAGVASTQIVWSSTCTVPVNQTINQLPPS